MTDDQREGGCDQFGSTLKESGKFVWSGGPGNVANVGGDFPDDATDDWETLETDESFVGEVG
jgi:hypothetical protein